jgi:hypothetical protein
LLPDERVSPGAALLPVFLHRDDAVRFGLPAEQPQPVEEVPHEEAAPAPGPAARSRSGRKPGQSPIAREACAAAKAILNDAAQHPKRPHGRRIALARMIRKRAKFKNYKLETIADYIRDIVAEWEKANPGK